jgi:hypothetical protein
MERKFDILSGLHAREDLKTFVSALAGHIAAEAARLG